MEHFFQKGSNDRQLVVAFHGTGGNEYQLLTTVARLYPEASILSYAGTHTSGSTRRFFAPLQNGQLDRTSFNQAVDTFLTNVWEQPFFEEIILIGYSNGANFILGLLEKNPQIANTVILLHPNDLVYQFEAPQHPVHVILTTGAQDTQSVPGEILRLAQQLEQTFTVTYLLVDGTHGLTEHEVEDISNVLKKNEVR